MLKPGNDSRRRTSPIVLDLPVNKSGPRSSSQTSTFLRIIYREKQKNKERELALSCSPSSTSAPSSSSSPSSSSPSSSLPSTNNRAYRTEALLKRQLTVQVAPSSPSKLAITSVIYIIRHSNPTLQFEPSSATLVKVGKSSDGILGSRFSGLISKAYKDIPELRLRIPTGSVRALEMQRAVGLVPENDPEETSDFDVVAVIPCHYDEEEVKTFEAEVRSRVGGALNDAMAAQLKKIVKLIPNSEIYGTKDIHSTEMVVSDCDLLDYIRKAWNDGRLKSPADFDALLPRRKYQNAHVDVSFCLSIAQHCSEPAGKNVVQRRNYDRPQAPPSELPQYTVFASNSRSRGRGQGDICSHPSVIDFATGGNFGEPFIYGHSYDTFLVAGQVRPWPTMEDLDSEDLEALEEDFEHLSVSKPKATNHAQIDRTTKRLMYGASSSS